MNKAQKEFRKRVNAEVRIDNEKHTKEVMKKIATHRHQNGAGGLKKSEGKEM